MDNRPSSAVKKSTANDLGADLDLSELLEPSDLLTADSGVRPRDAYGQAVGGRAEPPPQAQSRPQHPSEIDADIEAELEADSPGTPWHMMTRPLKVEGAPTPPPRSQNPMLFDGDFDPGLATFCRGAGIDPHTISPEARSAALQLAGQLVRESILGTHGPESGRS